MNKKRVIIVTTVACLVIVAIAVILLLSNAPKCSSNSDSAESAFGLPPLTDVIRNGERGLNDPETTESVPNSEVAEIGSEENPDLPQQSGEKTEACTVRFLGKDAEVLETRTVTKGESLLPPQAPEYEGYVFQQWDKSTENIQGDVSFRAMYWEVNEPAIVVDNLYIFQSQKTVIVKILLLNNPGLASMKFNLNYGDGLNLEAVELSNEFGTYITAPEPYTDPQAFNMISPFSNVDSSGVFATLTISIEPSVLPANASKIDLTINVDQDNVFSADYSEIPLQVNNGSITIIND